MKKRTLEEIINEEKKNRVEEGSFGIKACKDSIEWYKEHLGKSYFTQLEGFIQRANEDVFFNRRMVLACWELINEAI